MTEQTTNSREEPQSSKASPEPPRKQRSRWLRVLAYVLTVALWLLFVLPAGQYAEAGVVSGIVLVALLSMAVAAVARRLYVWRVRRPFLSPWLFAIAAFVAFVSVNGMRANQNEGTDEEAVRRGVATEDQEVSPMQRCVTKALESLESATPEQRAVLPAGLNFRSFSQRFCGDADRQGILAATGDLTHESEEFQAAICAEGTMIGFRQIAPSEQAFSQADFRLFADTYCGAVIERNLHEEVPSAARQKKLEAVQQEVLNELIDSGQIKRLR